MSINPRGIDPTALANIIQGYYGPAVQSNLTAADALKQLIAARLQKANQQPQKKKLGGPLGMLGGGGAGAGIGALLAAPTGGLSMGAGALIGGGVGTGGGGILGSMFDQ